MIEAKAGYSPGRKASLTAAFAAGLSVGVATSVPPVGAQEVYEETPTEEIAKAPFFEVTGPENVCGELDTLPSRVGPPDTKIVFSSELPGFSVGRKDNSGDLVILGSVPFNPNGIPRSANTESVWFVNDPEGNCVWAGRPEKELARVEIKRPAPQPLSPEPFVGEVLPRSKPVTNWEVYASDGEIQGWFFTETNGTAFPHAKNKGFLITGDFWQAYAENGGQETLGLPKTRQFQYKGQEVQVLQNGVLQREEDGTVNVLSNHELLTNLSLVPNEAKTLEPPPDTPPEVAIGPEPWGKTFSFGGGTLVIANDTLSAVRVTDMETVQKLVELIKHPNSKIKSFSLILADGIERYFKPTTASFYPDWSSSPVTDQILAGLVPPKTRNTASYRMSDRGIMEAVSGYFAAPTSTGDMYHVLNIYTPEREEEESRDDPENPSFSTRIIGGSIKIAVLFGDTANLPDRFTTPDWLMPYFRYFWSKNYAGFEFLGRPQISEEV